MIDKEKISPQNILIIRLSSLGDVLLTTPFVRILRNKYPESKIDFLVAKPFQEIFENNPHLNTVHIYDKSKTLKEISYWKKTIVSDLPENKYDLIIDLQNNRRSLHFAAGIFKNKIKYNKNRIDKLKLVYLKKIPENFTPIPERYIQSCSELGLKPDGKGCELFFETNIKSIDKHIALAPGAKHFTKRWLPEKYAELANKLIDNGYKVSLIGSKADDEICNKIKDLCPDVKNKSGATSIEETVSIIDSSELVISNDSAAMHIAAARNKPVVAIFGSTVRQFGFTPYKTEHIIEEVDLSCRPCTHIGRAKCPKKHFKCMEEISVESVYSSALKLLYK